MNEAQQCIEEITDSRFYKTNTWDTSNLFQVEDSICQLPQELFDLSDLGDILSVGSWNNYLSEEERQYLSDYLPAVDTESFQRTLKEIFGGQNMYFGNPVKVLWQQLKEGQCNLEAVRARKALILLQRKEYYHNLRTYHDGMVKYLRQMRDLWMSDPEANFLEKIKHQQVCKTSEEPYKARKLSKDRSKVDFQSRSVPLVDGGMPVSGSSLRAPLYGFSEESVLVQGLGSEKSFKPLSSRRRASPGLRDSVNVHSDQLAKGSRSKDAVSPKNGAWRKDLCLKRKSNVLENPEFLIKHSRFVKNLEDSDFLKGQHASNKRLGIRTSSMIVQKIDDHANVYNNTSSKQVSPCYDQNRSNSYSTISRSGESTSVSPVDSGFSFSILRFLSAVRASLVEGASWDDGYEGLLFKEIVAKVKACPGDLRVIKIESPVDCLVRGVLKVLSTVLREISMDGCQPFVSYDKFSKKWLWIGPMPGLRCTFKESDVQSVSRVWGVSPAVLEKIQSMFEKWLKSKESTLLQLWQLSQLSMPVFSVFPDERERFRDLKSQKSPITIPPSSYDMRTLFQKEELVRYNTLEIAFRYTTADGRKSTVAPLRKLGGKSKGKARDHFMLKADRPSHITILCLVRDAAARLPQSIGTRGDVCILLRDSQFIENVSESQLSHVVSGALDRLHQERDPCVRFDQDKKLWLYLHGDREEEDFEEGGTTSIRSLKRSKGGSGHPSVSPMHRDRLHDIMSDPEQDSGSISGSVCGKGSSSPELLDGNHHIGYRSVLVPRDASRKVKESSSSLPELQPLESFCGAMQRHQMGWEMYRTGRELSITQ
ncbi:hypothetical protein KP509_25G069900 [Ceratopteris richardii]|nr:hypothetical protein KP509_25G069900 [Ceratopteris richardii]